MSPCDMLRNGHLTNESHSVWTQIVSNKPDTKRRNLLPTRNLTTQLAGSISTHVSHQIKETFTFRHPPYLARQILSNLLLFLLPSTYPGEIRPLKKQIVKRALKR
jgi:hypothetical protein